MKKSETGMEMDLQWFADEGTGTGADAAGGDQSSGTEDSLENIMTGGDDHGKEGANGKSDTPPSSDGKTEEIKLAPWAEQLPNEIKGNPELAKRLAGFKTIGDLAKSHLDLDTQLSAVKKGIPESADGYEIAKDKDAADFVKLAHSVKLNNEQASTLYKQLTSAGENMIKAVREKQQEKQRTELLATETALKKEYGAKYPEKIELLRRGLGVAGKEVSAVLQSAGLSGNPHIVKAFITLGELTAESGGARGGGAPKKPISVLEGGSFEFEGVSNGG